MYLCTASVVNILCMSHGLVNKGVMPLLFSIVVHWVTSQWGLNVSAVESSAVLFLQICDFTSKFAVKRSSAFNMLILSDTFGACHDIQLFSLEHVFFYELLYFIAKGCVLSVISQSF